MRFSTICFTCRKSTQKMYEILDDISKGKGTLEHLDLLKELAEAVKDTTMCGLGQTASNPVLSTLRYFRDEYLHHVLDKKCGAFVCKELVGASCQRISRRVLPGRLSAGHRGLALCCPDRKGRIRRSLQSYQRSQPVPIGLRSGLRSQVRNQMQPCRQRGRSYCDSSLEKVYNR